MVAEFVARQSGSPINGETPSLNSSMPGGYNSSGGGGCVGANGANAIGNVSNGPGGQNAGAPSSAFCQVPDATAAAAAGILVDVARAPSPHAIAKAGGEGAPSVYPPPPFDVHLKRKELFSQRKQREFIPENKKDESYWDRRRRNNEAAKRSREKRRYNDMILETRVVELTKENHVLKAQLAAFKDKYGVCGESLISVEQVMATLPTTEQVLSFTKRPKLASGMAVGPQHALLYTPTPSPVPTPVIHQPVNSGSLGSASPPSPLHFGSGSGAPPPPPHALAHVHALAHPHGLAPHAPPSLEPSPFADADAAYAYPFSLTLPHHAPFEAGGGGGSVLNLSRSGRARERMRAQSPYELSSGSGDESSGPGPLPLTVSPTAVAAGVNNSLPHKLRHKTHLGDKDAATTLLSLQNIKQEPGPRASPPWDGEGSSDERDSGISLGVEWGAAGPLPPHRLSPNTHPHVHSAVHNLQHPVPAASPCGIPSATDLDCTGDEATLKNELARLASEVATIKSFLNSKAAAVAHQ